MEMFLAFNADAEINRSLLRDRARVVFERRTRSSRPSSPRAAGSSPRWCGSLRRRRLRRCPTSTPEARASPPRRQRPVPAAAPRVGSSAAALASLRRVLPASNRLGVGTNAWAISGAHTARGHALLANDPHLPLIAATILWGVHFAVTEGPDALDVTGVAFPGVPGVVFGHNPHLAWGITNAMFDQMDVYEETIVDGRSVSRPAGAARDPGRAHSHRAGWGARRDGRDGAAPRADSAGVRARGRAAAAPSSRALSVRWVAAEPSHEVDGLIALMCAGDYARRRRRCATSRCPAWASSSPTRTETSRFA